MSGDDRNVKLQLIETVKNIKRKFQTLNQESNELNDVLNLTYKPLLEPLNKLASNSDGNDEKKKSAVDLYLENVPKVSLDRIGLTSLQDFLNIIDTKIHDSTYGIRSKNDSYFIGVKQVGFIGSDKIEVSGESFPLTIGLLNLLFLKKPKYYLKSDIECYKQIILITNLHKTGHKANSRMRTDSKNEKFVNIIKPLFLKTGNSLQTSFMKFYDKQNIDYKYWDNPNELVDRLRLLIASQSAGHTGHDNEIIAIIEELREANIIK